MTTSLAFRILLSHFLPGLMVLPGGVALSALLFWLSGPQSCTSFTCCPGICVARLVNWAKENAALASLGVIAIPLILGIFVDDWRHSFWLYHEDDDERWDRGIEELAELPSPLFRFMYDEYYYYVEFDGNSSIAVGFSGLFVLLNYLRTNLHQLSWHTVVVVVLLLIVFGSLFLFLRRSWHEALDAFFEDLGATARSYRRSVRQAPSGGSQ